jgi:deoxyhypusine synthase
MSEAREFHDGRHDGLIALESLDLDRVTSFSDLLRGMSKTAFSGRSLGEALDVVTAMVKDPDCKVVMTLSGAMTIAKMGKVISKMIDTGMVQAIVSTGALMAHGLSEAVGLVHYRHDPRMSDEELFDKGYNRVYDTLEMEANLNYVEEFSRKALDALGGEAEMSSEVVCRALGRVLADDAQGSGVLRSA